MIIAFETEACNRTSNNRQVVGRYCVGMPPQLSSRNLSISTVFCCSNWWNCSLRKLPAAFLEFDRLVLGAGGGAI